MIGCLVQVSKCNRKANKLKFEYIILVSIYDIRVFIYYKILDILDIF